MNEHHRAELKLGWVGGRIGVVCSTHLAGWVFGCCPTFNNLLVVGSGELENSCKILEICKRPKKKRYLEQNEIGLKT